MLRFVFLVLLLNFFGGTISCNLEPNSPCGCGWFAYDNLKCFKFIPRELTQVQASQFCAHECVTSPDGLHCSATLASIDSSEEHDFIARTFLNGEVGLSDNVWIGAKRGCAKDTEFAWSDGAPLRYTNWAEGSPMPSSVGTPCVQMNSSLAGSSSGKWVDVTCDLKQYSLCQKFPSSIVPKLYRTVAELAEKLAVVAEELRNTRAYLINDLVNTKAELIQHTEDRLAGVEGAFTTTFEVDGDVNFYYPVGFRLPSESYGDNAVRVPLAYDIYRSFLEKAPESLNVGTVHYLGLTLKLLVSDGGSDAGSNQCKVVYHDWIYNKGVAKAQLMPSHEYRVFVWLRGGGVRYHIRSPYSLSDGGIQFNSMFYFCEADIKYDKHIVTNIGSHSSW